MKSILLGLALLSSAIVAGAQTNGVWTMKHLPDTGQTRKYTNTHGEDADYAINPPSFAAPGDGTVIDNVTGLVWQQVDGGEMTWSDAKSYAAKLSLAGHSDWRLPTSHELFSILNHGRNPALDSAYFPRTGAEYWWSSETLANDPNRVWVTNSGGGIGPHPANETVSAGGPKRFHVRCVRGGAAPPPAGTIRFKQNGDGTTTDLATSLMWTSTEAPEAMAWEDALTYASSSKIAEHHDWRLPNIKELQSLNDEARVNPSIDPRAFPGAQPEPYWSSTTLFNREPVRAWILDFRLGIATYDDKTARHRVRLVRDFGNDENSL